MQIKISDAKLRFDNTHFSNEVVDGRALPIFATYTCPQCGEKLGFEKSHFEVRSRLKVSNLAPDIDHIFSRYEKSKKIKHTGFLDWSCPKCFLPVRVYVLHWAGGRHGDAGVDITVVTELLKQERCLTIRSTCRAVVRAVSGS
jgi:hypothetical protein